MFAQARKTFYRMQYSSWLALRISGVQTGITPGSVKITNKNGIFGGFAGGPVVKTVLPMQGEWIAK